MYCNAMYQLSIASHSTNLASLDKRKKDRVAYRSGTYPYHCKSSATLREAPRHPAQYSTNERHTERSYFPNVSPNSATPRHTILIRRLIAGQHGEYGGGQMCVSRTHSNLCTTSRRLWTLLRNVLTSPKLSKRNETNMDNATKSFSGRPRRDPPSPD